MSTTAENKRQIIAQKAVIKKGGRFLILLRAENEKAFPELWDFPGGKLEEGEEPTQSLTREVKEETGLTVQAKNVEGTYELNLNNTPVKFVLCAVDVLSGDPEHIVIGEEHSEYRLATAEEIRDLKTMPYMKTYLNQGGYFDKVRNFVIDAFSKAGGLWGLKHFDRTVYWVEQLRPDADEALRIAAIAHDIERAFRDPSKNPASETDLGFKSDFFTVYHPEKGAEIIGTFLEEEHAPTDLTDRVKMLIAKHEVGGDDNQNLLKDADSISYFENQVDHFVARAPSMGAEKVRGKFEWMYERITSDKARKIAKPLYEVAMAKILK